MAGGDNGDTRRKTAAPTPACWTREAKCSVAGSSDNNQEVVQRAVGRGEESVERNYLKEIFRSNTKIYFPTLILNKFVSSSEEIYSVLTDVSLRPTFINDDCCNYTRGTAFEAALRPRPRRSRRMECLL